MKTIRQQGLFAALSICSILFLVSCQKGLDRNIPEGQQRIRIYLTDDPVPYDAVNVDIQRVIVQVIPDSCMGNGRGGNNDWDDDNDDWCDDDEYRCSVWDTLDIRPGIYDLLDLSNGVDTLLANGITISGRINKIRLVLGDNNTVVIDSVSYPLTLWNNRHTVDIDIKGADIDEIDPGDLQIWLDFDAGASIVKVSNNRFVLKPKIKVFVPSRTSEISGKVLPGSAHAIVAAYTPTDTLIAIPDDDNGRFKIRGLRGSTATLFINATANGYRDTTITNVQLTVGRETSVGTIQLRQ